MNTLQETSFFDREKAKKNIITLRKDIGRGLIALGQWLEIVKENLPHGEWMEFLKHDVKIPYVTAYRCLKIWKEIDYKDLETIGAGKIFEIFELPPSTFRKNLMEMSPTLTEKDIRQKVKAYKNELEGKNTAVAQADEEGEVVSDSFIEQASTSAVADAALGFNASFLDAMFRLSLEQLPDYYLELLSSQLKRTIKQTVKFLERIESVKQSRI